MCKAPHHLDGTRRGYSHTITYNNCLVKNVSHETKREFIRKEIMRNSEDGLVHVVY